MRVKQKGAKQGKANYFSDCYSVRMTMMMDLTKEVMRGEKTMLAVTM